MRPDRRVDVAVQRWGESQVVAGCADLLLGAAPEGDLLELAMALGQLTDPGWLAGGKPPGHAHWARVWAARALRYVWTGTAAAHAALRTLAWRLDRDLG